MAVRAPLYLSSGNLKEMSTTMVNQIVDQTVYQYSLSPSVALSVVSSGGSLGTLGSDTRLQAGAQSTSATAFPNEATTAEPSTVTVSYAKITSTDTPGSPTSDTAKTWPVYKTASNHIQAMTLADVKDTFLHPAIDLLVSGSTGTQQGGTYHITTTGSGSTLVSATPVFLDTRANTGAYTAGSIPEQLDQPTTITNYYLHKVAGSDTSYTLPIYITGTNDLREYAAVTFEGLLQEWIQYTAASSGDGYEINYSYSTGTNRGSGMADTKLDGSGNYQTRFVGADDYRAQEFPNGSTSTSATHYLKINKS